MAIYRTTIRWTGFQGAPGYTNFHFTDLSADPGPGPARAKTSAFINAVREVLPSDVSFISEGEVAVLDETTGMVTDYVTVEPNPVAGQGGRAGGYSAASGAVVTWNTAGVRNGRRVRGRTFLVPLAGNSYDDDGTLTSDVITTISDAASELVGESGFESGFCVYSRPSATSAGGVFPVIGFRVPDMAAVLRSRRD